MYNIQRKSLILLLVLPLFEIGSPAKISFYAHIIFKFRLMLEKIFFIIGDNKQLAHGNLYIPMNNCTKIVLWCVPS